MPTHAPIVIVVFPGAEPLDVAGPAAVFARARDLSPDAPDIIIASPLGGTVKAEGGASFADTVALSSLAGPFDLILIAGGTEPGLRALNQGMLPDWLQRAAPHARRVGSVCGGAFVLGRSGLLVARRATTHWSATARLKAMYPETTVEPDAIYTIDGPICTSAGVTAGIDLALALVEVDHGAKIAANIARQLVVFLRRPGGQSQFSEALKAQTRSGSRLSAALDEIQSHPDGDLCVSRLAALCAMSARSFTRRFTHEIGTSPAAFVSAARLDHAKRLLMTTQMPVTSIAFSCGYGSLEAMNHVFRVRLGVAPSDFRKRMGASA